MTDKLHTWEAAHGGACNRMRVPNGWIYEMCSYDQRGAMIGHSHVFVPMTPQDILREHGGETDDT